jgi:gas vesicle protein
VTIHLQKEMNMQEHSSSSVGNVLLAFLAGAAVGGLVVALTTPKSGDEMRADLKGLGGRLKAKAGEALETVGATCDEADERVGAAASDVKRGVQDAAQDLRG